MNTDGTYKLYLEKEYLLSYKCKGDKNNCGNGAVGIDNLFDKDLPFGTSGTGGGSAAYDNLGRFYYMTVSYSM